MLDERCTANPSAAAFCIEQLLAAHRIEAVDQQSGGRAAEVGERLLEATISLRRTRSADVIAVVFLVGLQALRLTSRPSL